MTKIALALLVAAAVGTAVVLFMTQSYGGGDAAAARTACVSINAYATRVGFDARTARGERRAASPTSTPGLQEILDGAKTPSKGGMKQLQRVATWCVGRGFGPTPTP